MKFAVLGSGSAGNSSIIECGNARLLIDAGLSARQLRQRLGLLGIDPASLSGIVLTHEHGDHVRGLKNFLKTYNIPIYATRDTAHVVREQGLTDARWHTFQAGQGFTISHLKVQSFAIQHDAVDPVGFVVSNDFYRLGFVSDTGHITRSMTAHLSDLTVLYVEANYCDDLLERDTKRPWSIKQRISSKHGHLSNAQVCELLEGIAHPGLSQIVLGHLSSDCNCPKKVTALLGKCLGIKGLGETALYCATQADPTPWFEVAEPFRLISD